MMDTVRYPIGRYNPDENTDGEQTKDYIDQLEKQPVLARQAVERLTEDQIDTPYREDGWTLRQVIHHVADTNINAYARFKMALTENKPTIKLWDEVTWAELEDAIKAPVDLSLAILDAVHARWIILIRSLISDDLKKELVHPEMGTMTLAKFIQFYAWHGNHHIAQVQSFRVRMNW